MADIKLEKCIFTGNLIKNVEIHEWEKRIEYNTDIEGHNHLFIIPIDALEWQNDNPFFNQNKNILEGLLLNNKWLQDEKETLTEFKLKELIDSKEFPKTPKEKADNLLLKLY